MVGCALSIVLKLFATYDPARKVMYDNTSTVLILGLVSALSIYIFVKMLQGAKAEIASKRTT